MTAWIAQFIGNWLCSPSFTIGNRMVDSSGCPSIPTAEFGAGRRCQALVFGGEYDHLELVFVSCFSAFGLYREIIKRSSGSSIGI